MTRAIDPELIGIVTAAADGDDIAFGRIVAAHHDDMRRLCTFVAGDGSLAEDAVQVAWSVAWRKLGSLRDPASLRPWLMRIAVNEAKRLMASSKRRADVEGAAFAGPARGGTDPSTGIERIDMVKASSCPSGLASSRLSGRWRHRRPDRRTVSSAGPPSEPDRGCARGRPGSEGSTCRGRWPVGPPRQALLGSRDVAILHAARDMVTQQCCVVAVTQPLRSSR